MDPVKDQLDALEDRLPPRFANPDVPESKVRDLVRRERERFADAPIRSFIPILVERAVAERTARRHIVEPESVTGSAGRPPIGEAREPRAQSGS
jgi:hypothetical protein